MNSITFTIHTIRVYSLDNKDESLPLKGFDEGRDLFSDFLDFLATFRTKSSLDERRKEIFTVKDYAICGRLAKGIIETGEYGYESSIYDVENNQETYRRKPNEAEMLPFFFVFCAPRNANEGIIGLLRVGQKGIQTNLYTAFYSYFAEKHRTFRIEINNLVPNNVIDQLLDKGFVRSIRLISYRIPQSVEEVFYEPQREVRGSIEVTLKAGRKEYIPAGQRLRELVSKERTITNFVEIPGFEPQEIKVDFDINGKKRSINLANIGSFRPDYDITDVIEIAPNGHPTFDSLDRATESIIRDTIVGMGLEEKDVYED